MPSTTLLVTIQGAIAAQRRITQLWADGEQAEAHRRAKMLHQFMREFTVLLADMLSEMEDVGAKQYEHFVDLKEMEKEVLACLEALPTTSDD